MYSDLLPKAGERRSQEIFRLEIPIEEDWSSIEEEDRYPALPTRDAVHAATMLNNGISDIVTSDGHFDGVQGIRRLPLAGFMP